MSRAIGVGLVILGIILMGLFFIPFCQGCVGWNVINPLCYIGYAMCVTYEFILKLILALVGLIVFLIGIWKTIRG